MLITPSGIVISVNSSQKEKAEAPTATEKVEEKKEAIPATEEVEEVEEVVENSEDSEDLSKKTLTELKAAAKEAGIKGYSAMKKDELITLLSE